MRNTIEAGEEMLYSDKEIHFDESLTIEGRAVFENCKIYCCENGNGSSMEIKEDGKLEFINCEIIFCDVQLKELPPLTVYETEYSKEEEAIESSVGVKETTVTVDEDGKYVVEGEWLYNFMGQINFDDYESLNFFQRVLIKNGVIDKLRKAGIEEGDTVSIYDFEFDFVY